MSIVTGFGTDTPSAAGLDLAAEIARTTGDRIVITNVAQDAWESLHDFAGVEDDWRRGLRAQAEETLSQARRRIGEDISVETALRTGRSVPQSLIDEAAEREARIIVAGSSATGLLGHISLGSTTDRLVHSAETPVALAPRGYRSGERTIGRLVLAVDPTHADLQLAEQAADLAAWLGCPIEIVTFAVRSSSRTAFDAFADQGVAQAWTTSVLAHQEELVARLKELAPATAVTATQVVTGDRWSRTLDAYPWNPGDLLVVGSSEYGPITRVFLGSTATRIVQHSPVPVILLPRGREKR